MEMQWQTAEQDICGKAASADGAPSFMQLQLLRAYERDHGPLRVFQYPYPDEQARKNTTSGV